MFILIAAVSIQSHDQILSSRPHHASILLKKRTDYRVMHHDHYIRILRHLVQYRSELRQLHFERMEFFAEPRTGMFEGFDQFRGAFVAGWVELVFPCV